MPRQYELLAVNRNRLEEPEQEGVASLSDEDARVVKLINQLHVGYPERGARRFQTWRPGRPGGNEVECVL
jgi:hypothetical protein